MSPCFPLGAEIRLAEISVQQRRAARPAVWTEVVLLGERTKCDDAASLFCSPRLLGRPEEVHRLEGGGKTLVFVTAKISGC